jgi:hypothetical protein
MNRRSYLKNILIITGIGAVSFSMFKGFEILRPFDINDLLKKRELLAQLVEIIIPETDTPGAKSARVHDYIIKVMINCNLPKQQRRFLTGLEDLEEYSVSKYDKDFLKCNSLEKHDIVEYFSLHSGYSYRILNKIDSKLLGVPFFTKLRQLTVEGFCQSQLGATKALAYDYIPQSFQACIPIQSTQKSWATK